MTAHPVGLLPADDDGRMMVAIEAAARSRLVSPPNPWVGALLVTADGEAWAGSTRRPGHNHAEREVLEAAGDGARGATVYVTLEPCSHQGRTGPCADALIAADVARVVYAVDDPDPQVAGLGAARLRSAGIEVTPGVGAEAVEAQLEPYLHHRRTGRPWVVLKTASTLDGRTAAADGTSQWITGPEARADAHRLRAECDAVVVGAGTVRDDDPRLTVRGVTATDGEPPREPLRVVLGSAPAGAAVHPCVELSGEVAEILADLGDRGIVQVLVEGGAAVAGSFHRSGLVDHYVIYLAPALMGGDDGRSVLAGPGAANIDDAFRGTIVSTRSVGPDLRIDVRPEPASRSASGGQPR